MFKVCTSSLLCPGRPAFCSLRELRRYQRYVFGVTLIALILLIILIIIDILICATGKGKSFKEKLDADLVVKAWVVQVYIYISPVSLILDDISNIGPCFTQSLSLSLSLWVCGSR